MFPQFDKLIESDFDQNSGLLSEAGVSDAAQATRSLMRLRQAFENCQSSEHPNVDPQWYKTLMRVLLEAPLPGNVVHTVDQFVARSKSALEAFSLFKNTPRSLEVIGRLACGSPFLTQTLLNQPSALRDLTAERRTAEMKSRNEFLDEAQELSGPCESLVEKLSALRRYQRREILRIGMCDAFGLLDLKFVTLQISLLADAMVQVCLKIVCDNAKIDEPPFSVLALGKHGGEELNYSSDIDLILVADKSSATAQRVARQLIDALSDNLSSGFLYRVDMRLRPWGDAGPLVTTPGSYEQYLLSDAELWEKQALLKARVIAGDTRPGIDLLKRLPAVLYKASSEDIFDSIRRMKGYIEDRLRKAGKLAFEVKLGAGSIRDIEFLVQALQLTHGNAEPRLASANTLDALVRLAEFGILNATEYRQLREGYIFLRTIEHALQLLHNQQTHELPADPEQRIWLARRLDYPNESVLLTRFEEHRRAVRAIFDEYFHMPSTLADSNTVSQTAAGPITDQPSRELSSSQLNQHFSANTHQHEQLRRQMLDDVESGQRCRVHSEAWGADGHHALLTIVCLDTPELLSMICGLFFALQLDIREGCTVKGTGRNRFGHAIPDGRFLGLFLVASPASATSRCATTIASEVEESLQRMVAQYRAGDGQQVRRDLVQIFCDRIEAIPESASPQADLVIRVSDDSPQGTTQLKISADDSFGFFFELASALGLCGFRITSAELGAAGGRIQDVLQVTEADGSAINDARRVAALETAVTLIKQFTHWLPSNNDPLNALLRFRELLQKLLSQTQWESNVAALRQPQVLRNVSRVLGLSRYLWEDFLRVRSRDLLVLMQESGELERRVARDELESELSQMIAEAEADRVNRALNRFKDQHLFRIDLRHVLGHCGPFGSFSAEVTELAEIVVEAAAIRAWQQLSAMHGVPIGADGQECAFVIAALGKFGGVEMGFASDIEMFVIFQEDGETSGAAAISTANFFERLAGLITRAIEARHKGIFEVDLRMRPYGQAGSPAVSAATFQRYFGLEGDAWPYERQSLVKMRCIGGNAAFAAKLICIRDDLIFSPQCFDFSAMRAMREKQIRQLVHGGTINAKLSEGGLVDCEYAVQALQLTFGKQHPNLRASNTLAALSAAGAAGLLTDSQLATAQEAYMFLREVIDCLRMVRGNAQDLTVPATDSADYVQLAKRMDKVHDSEVPLASLESQMQHVRLFSQQVERLCGDATTYE